MVKSCLRCFFSTKQIVRTENEIPALVFDPGTEAYTLRKLENIDVEKAIYRNFPPRSAHPIKVQLFGGIEAPVKVRVDDVRKRRAPKHQSPLAHGFYIMPGRAGTQTTITPEDTQDDQLAEPLAPRFFSQKKHSVEIPADEIPLSLAHPPPPTPPLLPPKPRSPHSCKASAQRTSYGSSIGSATIQIAYLPNPSDDVEREKGQPLEALNSDH